MKYELTEEQMEAIAHVHAMLEIVERDMQSLFREDSVICKPISKSLNILTPIVNEYTDQREVWRVKKLEFKSNIMEEQLGIEYGIWTMDVDLDAKHPWPSMKYVKVEDTVKEIRGKTWADLWVAADRAINHSGTHRHFIENFYPSSEPFTLTVVLESY